MFLFFESLSEPTSYSMDTLRKFFGMPSDHAHEALQDVKDTADFMCMFMKLVRRYTQKLEWEGSYKRKRECLEHTTS